jgi:hypothetical protein
LPSKNSTLGTSSERVCNTDDVVRFSKLFRVVVPLAYNQYVFRYVVGVHSLLTKTRFSNISNLYGH